MHLIGISLFLKLHFRKNLPPFYLSTKQQFRNKTVLAYRLTMVTKHLWQHYPFEKNRRRYKFVLLLWQLFKIHLQGWEYKETGVKNDAK